MNSNLLNSQFQWLKDNEIQLQAVKIALRLICSPYSFSIFRILNKKSKVTCKDILVADDKLEETKVYEHLKELEKLNFISAETKRIRYKFPPNFVYKDDVKNEQVFSLNKSEVGRFIDCVIDSGSGDAHKSSNLEIENSGITLNVKYVLNSDQLKVITDSVDCLCSPKKRELLDRLSKENKPITDKDFYSSKSKQSVVSINLRQLAEVGLIFRNELSKFKDNKLNADRFCEMVSFIQSVSYLNFNNEIHARRPVPYKYPTDYRDAIQTWQTQKRPSF